MKQAIIFLLLLVFFASLAFFLPRSLVHFLGIDHALTPYIYIYGSGVPFFILGLVLLIRSKALDLTIPGEKKWLLFFILGLTWNILAHGVWIVLAEKWPYLG